ncbi:cytochrome D ubiquinol oxidase subunit 1 [Candidatus Kinetoplastibacterium desouzaii TCC079E]|uniref:Cytochrome D ubiquinol oxidase subunit 1 n=1 Tax=Candidatus Kinetoplastidibacterium desouzai TCC079E TaxID=1208919 RepID=M1LVB5_9PROT|nr:cytochrome ubiquinol oxidase subunit I [Candidatus Kinetoplastibacterium desouzaii]AGF47199.1 cytochrome D ubiquinol oxidase subunit 1 [Candidatus Kinetoplastibacterium desouzaii TCC079E]
MFDFDVVSLSRFQFAATAFYHFIFVPLTLGLSVMVAIMESVYVITDREIWKRITMFWGTLFGINFALGVATGVVMEFQFGMNWSYYSHYVGDIFGAPLAIEGLMAFFLEATFVGIFFFGWDRLSKVSHLIVAWLVAIGTNLSALWILVANAWMQNPVGAVFNPDTMRMEMTDFFTVLLNPVAQSKFVHTVSAGYITGAVFVLAISSWYLLKDRHIDIAKRSIAVAVAFGFCGSISAVILGDESGYLANDHQKMKLAAIESMWESEPAPASFNLLAIPNSEKRKNDFEVKIPYLMGIIATRSLTEELVGINDLVEKGKDRIRNGITAYQALEKIRSNPSDEESRVIFNNNWKDLGHGLLVKHYKTNFDDVTEDDISKASLYLIPNGIGFLFYAFRIMVLLGFYFIVLFTVSLWFVWNNRFYTSNFLKKLAFYSLSLPWIAIECGWFVAEYGRQPWVIDGVLPTYYAASGLTIIDLSISLAVFLLLYTLLFIIGFKIMLKAVKQGPDSHDDVEFSRVASGKIN